MALNTLRVVPLPTPEDSSAGYGTKANRAICLSARYKGLATSYTGVRGTAVADLLVRQRVKCLMTTDTLSDDLTIRNAPTVEKIRMLSPELVVFIGVAGCTQPGEVTDHICFQVSRKKVEWDFVVDDDGGRFTLAAFANSVRSGKDGCFLCIPVGPSVLRVPTQPSWIVLAGPRFLPLMKAGQPTEVVRDESVRLSAYWFATRKAGYDYLPFPDTLIVNMLPFTITSESAKVLSRYVGCIRFRFVVLSTLFTFQSYRHTLLSHIVWRFVNGRHFAA